MPGVAETWTVSDDGLTWTIKLKQTTWSDGEPLTADDFVFRFQRLFDPERGGDRLRLDPVRHQEWPRGERRTGSEGAGRRARGR